MVVLSSLDRESALAVRFYLLLLDLKTEYSNRVGGAENYIISILHAVAGIICKQCKLYLEITLSLIVIV